MSIYCKDESIKVAIGSIETENIGCYILVLLSNFCVFVFLFMLYIVDSCYIASICLTALKKIILD